MSDVTCNGEEMRNAVCISHSPQFPIVRFFIRQPVHQIIGIHNKQLNEEIGGRICGMRVRRVGYY